MVIDWSKFESTGKYVSFQDDVAKKLVLTNWRETTTQFENKPPKPGLRIDVVSEDGKACDPFKEIETSNYSLLSGLRPVIEKAERDGVGSVSVAIQRSGQGKGTKYVVMAL